MMKPKPDASRAGPKRTSFTMMNYIDIALQASFNGVSALRRARRYSSISTRGSVGIMLH
jgi:hypothetical protein